MGYFTPKSSRHIMVVIISAFIIKIGLFDSFLRISLIILMIESYLTKILPVLVALLASTTFTIYIPVFHDEVCMESALLA